MGTWNVAGIVEEQFDLFVEQLSDHYPWDFILLQETFQRTEGIQLGAGHVLFTSSTLLGKLRCPAILVNERWAASATFAGSRNRWVAIDINETTVLISLHLPHRGHHVNEFIACLEELKVFLSTVGGRRVFLGMDANTCVGSVVDYVHIGEGATLQAYDPMNSERALLLHDFLVQYGLCLVNTFKDDPEELRYTRTNWSGFGSTQIDFLAFPLQTHCTDAGVDQSMTFSTDHRMVWASIKCQMQPIVNRSKLAAPRNWRPSDSWADAAAELAWEWDDWEDIACRWTHAARKNWERKQKAPDIVLENLLEQHSAATPDIKRRLNKRIWRHRRAKRRRRAKDELRVAAEKGAMPNTRPKSTSINWQKVFGDSDAKGGLQDYFKDIYSLDDEEKAEEVKVKMHWIGTWKDLRIDMSPHRVSLGGLRNAIKKLKNGKGSSDGCTAEMYKKLPEHALQSLAIFFTTLFATLVIPELWTVVAAVLIPKVVGASSLHKFRAIACLPTARKLFGYLWMQMLPPLRYESFQTGFVRGGHAASGVYAVKRAAELSREWKHTMYVAQLDLRKAFDRVKHSAIINALRLQGCSLQCVVVLCAMLMQCQMAASLGHVSAPQVDMHRGLPQGAPESPLLFTLVSEMVLRPLLYRWRKRGSGWLLDEFWLSAICYADDIMLVSSDKKDLERMVSEVIDAFSEVGLGVGTDKSHWTSYPAMAGTHFKFGQDEVVWERSLTFVGTVLDLCGNDAAAIDYRLAQATKVFHKWRKILQCPFATMRCRIDLTCKTVFAAFLWLSETWHPTKRQRSHMESWGARMVARVSRAQRKTDEPPNEFWRRLHRTGHAWLKTLGGGITCQRRRRLHAFAGHLARTSEGPLRVALRSRPLAWWRYHQSRGTAIHPSRFHVWRWEEQLSNFYGEAESNDGTVDVGWMHRATDRARWREGEAKFACI